jgi:ATP-dependent Clp protease ATP-binding subunit ClpA
MEFRPLEKTLTTDLERFRYVRTIHRSRTQGHATGQPRSAAFQSRIHRHRTHPFGLVKEGSGVAANVLKNLDVDLRKIRLEVEKLVQSGPEMVTIGKLPQTPRAKKVIEYSMEEARNLNHNYVGTEHILLGLLARTRRRCCSSSDEPRPETGRCPRRSAQPARPWHGKRRSRRARRTRRHGSGRIQWQCQGRQEQDSCPRQLSVAT